MSTYAYFCCHQCKQSIWLGKALHEDHKAFAFHIGNDETKHWLRPQLNKLIWKFLADHTGHNIDVRLEEEMTDEMFGYQAIGGDRSSDVSVEKYLSHPSDFYK